MKLFSFFQECDVKAHSTYYKACNDGDETIHEVLVIVFWGKKEDQYSNRN
jgi:hypothetical protein